MTDLGRRSAAAPMFQHHLHLAEALLLSDNDDDDDVDARLLAAARENGIEHPHLFLTPPPTVLDVSTLSLDSEQRSSLSVHSRETQSTTPTSLLSHHSRDKSPMSRLPPSFARASFSLDQHRDPSDLSATSMRHKHSSSASTALSFSSRSVMRSYLSRGTKRASALFSLFRHDRRGHCLSRAHHHHYFELQSSKLECGHSLSKYAIRVHVQDALENKDGTAPACCGYPLPRRVLAIVLTNAEVDLVADNILPVYAQVSWRHSAYSENSASSSHLPQILDYRDLVSEPALPPTPTMQLDELDEIGLDLALSCEVFQKLQRSQREQFRRILACETNQRRALWLNHQSSLDRFIAPFEVSELEKKRQHMQQLENLDQLQLQVEYDLRESHSAETRNVATALKHMEAYCLGPNPVCPEFSYTVTEQDWKKLEHQRMVQEKLPFKHESAINVLRAKQERDTQVKLEKQQSQLIQLKEDREEIRRLEEERYELECHQLDTVIETRRNKIIQRWNLRFEIWRRWWQKESATTLVGDIPQERWPDLRPDAKAFPQ